MNHCATCKHWKEAKAGKRWGDFDPPRPKTGWGACVQDNELRLASGDYGGYGGAWDSDTGTLYTAPGFGCVLHESEPCPECKGAGGFAMGDSITSGGWRGCSACMGTKVKGGRIEVR